MENWVKAIRETIKKKVYDYYAGIICWHAYHKKHLDLISSERSAPVILQQVEESSEAWRTNTQTPLQLRHLCFQDKMAQLWPPCDRGHQAARASCSRWPFWVRFPSTIDAFDAVILPPFGKKQLLQTSLLEQGHSSCSTMTYNHEHYKIWTLHWRAQPARLATELKLKMPADLNAAFDSGNSYMHV